MHKELKQPKKIFEIYRKHSKIKKIVLQNKFVFTIEELLQITKEAKSINATKSAQKWLQKCPIQAVLDNEEKKRLNNNSNGSDSDCIIVATHR